MKYSLLVTCAFFQLSTFAQSLSYDTLRLPKRTALLLTADTLLVNHLIMADSSTIILGAEITFLKTCALEVGVHCSIVGDGMDAVETTNSSNPISSSCAANGENGKSLILISTSFTTQSALSIFLNGGNGGDGNSTFLPGYGGVGGTLSFIGSSNDQNEIARQVILKNEGGLAGRYANSPENTHSPLSSKKGGFTIIVNEREIR